MFTRLQALWHRLHLYWLRLPAAYLITILALIASLMTSVLIAVHWQASLSTFDQGRLDRFGQAMSAQLAALAVEPLIAGDRVRLGVLAQRMSEFPEIESVRIYTIDNRVVAEAGARPRSDSLNYQHAIGFEETLAGYVGITVDPAVFRTASALSRLWLPALLMLALSAALGYGLGRHLELRGTRPNADNPSEQPAPAAEPVQRAQYLVLINLFNQLALPSAQRSHVLGRCRSRVELVARLYRGQCVEVPGTGLLLLLSQQDETDFCFRALCAALLCADLLEELNDGEFAGLTPRLAFRFGLHLVTAPGDISGAQTPPWIETPAALIDSDLCADAVLLSALAGNGAIALSADAFASLERPDRCLWQHQRAPVLATLNTAIPGICTLVSDLTDAYRVLLDNEVELLLAQSGSTARPSTF